ncbi:hypothetical protein EMGBS15_14760 [Filimonas sp.]|nr:hypothetical protein EMGBS15_14760 [Filimonas sp.]
MILIESMQLLLLPEGIPNSIIFLLIPVLSINSFISFIPPQGVTSSSVYSCRMK